jgi:hypothetical protein
MVAQAQECQMALVEQELHLQFKEMTVVQVLGQIITVLVAAVALAQLAQMVPLRLVAMVVLVRQFQ